jgi:hypothetical protein
MQILATLCLYYEQAQGIEDRVQTVKEGPVFGVTQMFREDTLCAIRKRGLRRSLVHDVPHAGSEGRCTQGWS